MNITNEADTAQKKEVKKLFKEYHLPPIEFVKFQLNQSINFPIPLLNDTIITILAYVYYYGPSAKDKIVGDRILTSKNSCINYISTLIAQGYLVRNDDKTVSLNPKLLILDSDYMQINLVKLDTSKNEVYHPYYKR
jgi:hypothetical protein